MGLRLCVVHVKVGMKTQYDYWKQAHDCTMLELEVDKVAKQFIGWPPPDWTECIVSWDWLLSTAGCAPQDIYNWCEQHSGRYHVHGWQSTKGFAFRFEDPRDAVVFKLRWPTQ